MKKHLKQLVAAASVSIAATLIVCLIVVSCLSCENRPMRPLPKLTDEERRLQEKAAWEALMAQGDWAPQIVQGLSTGVSPFDPSPATIRISKDSNQKHVAEFWADGLCVANGVVECDGKTGALTVRNVEYLMTFSKNPDGSSPVIAIYYDTGAPVCYDLAARAVQ